MSTTKLASFLNSKLLKLCVLGALCVHSQAKSYACSYVERYENCPDTQETVCSVYPGVCVSASCEAQEYYNRCYACQDPSVMAYSLGPCKATTSPQNGTNSTTNSTRCIQEIDNSTQLLNSGGSGSLVGSDDDLLLYMEEGVTDDADPLTGSNQEVSIAGTTSTTTTSLPLRTSFYVTVYCDTERPTVCTNDVNPVCVTSCLNGQCQNTVNNICLACSNTNALSYSLGACEEVPITCPTIDFNTDTTTCTSFYDPVCAYPTNCTSKSCATTITNSCEACFVSQASYYTLGPC